MISVNNLFSLAISVTQMPVAVMHDPGRLGIKKSEFQILGTENLNQ